VVVSKKERDQLIKEISKASGIAQYALTKKMTDEQVIEAAQHLAILQLVKDASNYNRYCQGQKTKEANDKLKEFLSLEKSEIFNAGKWLINAISKTGQERKKVLLEQELIHKEDYNETVSDMRDTITTIQNVNGEVTENAIETIQDLEKRIDTLRNQLLQIQNYISSNYGADKWKLITKTFNIK
jgi:hypothetical protein